MTYRHLLKPFFAIIIMILALSPNLVAAKEGYCQKGITLQSIERLSGQGIGEGKLEVTVESSLPSRNVSANTGQLKLGKGGVQYPDLHVGSLWVPMDGSGYKQTLRTEITEHEVGADKFVGGTDRGAKNSTFTVDCGTTNADFTQKIKIKGRKTAKVKVTYVIGPLEREYKEAGQALRPGADVARSTVVTREPGTDRPGKDYRNFSLEDPNPGLCAQKCSEENRCEAYTYVPPGVQAEKAQCWLKESVPGARSQNGLVSGVKQTVRVPTKAEINLPGRDYRNFALAKAEPIRCASACAEDSRCVAYTYVKPGLQGDRARCWLKDSVPNRVNDDCCVSGVKQASN